MRRPYCYTVVGRAVHRVSQFRQLSDSSNQSAITKRINQLRGTPGMPVWQRNYYEHVIRNEQALNQIRKYILENPLCWHLDRENPNALGKDTKWESWIKAGS